MSDENQGLREAFISYLDEKNIKREGYFKLVHVDSSFVKFKTWNGTLLIIPSCRILKIKSKEEVKEDEDRRRE